MISYKTILFSLSVLSFLPSCSAEPQETTQPKTEKSIEAEWTNLLEGDSLALWRSWRNRDLEDAIGWTVKDGVLHLSKASEVKKHGGSIIALKEYQDFEFKFDFKISVNGNSGVKYRSYENLGLEYQIIDDVDYRDNKNPTHRTAALYEIMAASETKKLNLAGEWNSGRIVAKGNQLEHWLNGEKILSIEFGSEDWKSRFAKSKYKKETDFAQKAGQILLQDHNDEVSYRNLFIRELK